METYEWNVIREEVERIARSSHDILGALAVYGARADSTEVWLSVRDTELSAKSHRLVELGGAALKEEIDGGTIKSGTAQWHNKKRMVFGDYYHNPALYPDTFKKANGFDDPWEARAFKHELLDRLPVLSNEHIIINAQPESLFHLRTEAPGLYGESADGMPFPLMMDETWIAEDPNKKVLFASQEASIFPFATNGRVLGSLMERHYAEVKNNTARVNYGGILLKPDAIMNDQADIILDKISKHVDAFDGKIIAREFIEDLSADDVQAIYPLLRGKELEYAVRYLTSGPVMGVIIEMPGGITEVLKRVNSIKGPRITDRTEARLTEGRIENGGIRDLLPLPEDEEKYRMLLDDIRLRRVNPDHQFTEEQYRYLARNLAHTPDNTVELSGLLSFMRFDCPL